MEDTRFRRYRDDMYCHGCEKSFVAELDCRVEGNHEIHCPHCDHIHYRVVTEGIVTSERYDSDSHDHIKKARVWKSEDNKIRTLTQSVQTNQMLGKYL